MNNVETNRKTTEKRKSSVLGIISVIIPSAVVLLILNFFIRLVPTGELGGLYAMSAPFAIAPIGFIIAVIGYKMSKDRLSLIGMIYNIVLFLFPILYFVLGTLIAGV